MIYQFAPKFKIGDKVKFITTSKHKLTGFIGWITAVTFYQSRHMDIGMVGYVVDPDPDYEHDDEQRISECNLIKIN